MKTLTLSLVALLGAAGCGVIHSESSLIEREDLGPVPRTPLGTAPSLESGAVPKSAPTPVQGVASSAAPIKAPSAAPSAVPSAAPSTAPSTAPSAAPIAVPSAAPISAPSAEPSTAPSAVPSDVKTDKVAYGSACLPTLAKTESLVNGDISLPAKGRFFRESHLATKEDFFDDDRIFPQGVDEGLSAHRRRTCEVLRAKWPETDCAEIYKAKDSHEWTPPEHGLRGQGAVGNQKPTVLEEAFTFNLGWKSRSKPKPGARYLLRYKDRAVVVVGGYEVGPFDDEVLGGVQPEIAYFLHADNESELELSYLADQTHPLGPVDCSSK